MSFQARVFKQFIEFTGKHSVTVDQITYFWNACQWPASFSLCWQPSLIHPGWIGYSTVSSTATQLNMAYRVFSQLCQQCHSLHFDLFSCVSMHGHVFLVSVILQLAGTTRCVVHSLEYSTSTCLFTFCGFEFECSYHNHKFMCWNHVLNMLLLELHEMKSVVLFAYRLDMANLI